MDAAMPTMKTTIDFVAAVATTVPTNNVSAVAAMNLTGVVISDMGRYLLNGYLSQPVVRVLLVAQYRQHGMRPAVRTKYVRREPRSWPEPVKYRLLSLHVQHRRPTHRSPPASLYRRFLATQPTGGYDSLKSSFRESAMRRHMPSKARAHAVKNSSIVLSFLLG